MMNRMRKSSSSGAKKPTPPSTAFYEELFNKYKEADENSISPAGMEKLCTAISVDPADVLMLVLAWSLGAGQMGYFSHSEWQSGLGKLGSVASEAELKERLEDIHKSTLRNAEDLRDLHIFTHKFCREERRKNIDVASAQIMLQLLLKPVYAAHVAKISEFLEQNKEIAKRGVSLDEWTMLLQFCREIQPDCSNFADDGAWPLVLDDYVEWRKEQDGGKDS